MEPNSNYQRPVDLTGLPTSPMSKNPLANDSEFDFERTLRDIDPHSINQNFSEDSAEGVYRYNGSDDDDTVNSQVAYDGYDEEFVVLKEKVLSFVPLTLPGFLQQWELGLPYSLPGSAQSFIDFVGSVLIQAVEKVQHELGEAYQFSIRGEKPFSIRLGVQGDRCMVCLLMDPALMGELDTQLNVLAQRLKDALDLEVVEIELRSFEDSEHEGNASSDHEEAETEDDDGLLHEFLEEE